MNRDMTTTQQISHFTRAIRDQIGVGTLMAIGARDFVYSNAEGERYLQFTVTGKRGYLTSVRVTLEPSDTYTVRHGRFSKRTFEFGWLSEIDLVYADSLSSVVRLVCGECESVPCD